MYPEVFTDPNYYSPLDQYWVMDRLMRVCASNYRIFYDLMHEKPGYEEYMYDAHCQYEDEFYEYDHDYDEGLEFGFDDFMFLIMETF